MSRYELFCSKEEILFNLKQKGGKLVLSHEIDNPVVIFNV
jgi:hypothetical protein